MYLYARTVTANPARALDALAFATSISETVSRVAGTEVRAWATLYGAPITTIAWTTRVESYAAMGAIGEKLQADPGYMEQVADVSELFDGAPQDMLADIVATAGTGDLAGDYANVITAECANGRIVDAMTWGVDILNHVSGITGLNGAFTRSMHGPFGAVAWISLAASLDEVDAATAAMAGDAAYLGKLDSAGGLFVPGSSESRLSHRIA